MSRGLRRGALIGAAALGLLGVRISIAATAASGDLFFDTFQDIVTSAHATIQKVHYTWNGTTLQLTAPSLIRDMGTTNADGLIFAPNGDLLVGGSNSHLISRVSQSGSLIGTITVGGSDPYHLSLSPDGVTIYSGGSTSAFTGDNPGPLGVSPVFSNGTSHTLTGSDTTVTQIAFDSSGNAYYTSSPDTGTGDFGTINLSTFTTNRALQNLAGAHGITFDPFTHDLILAGGSHIVQINPATLSVVSSRDVSSLGLSMLDQVSVDGSGHLFVGDNGNILSNTAGKLVFIDYSQTGLIGDSTSILPTPPSVALALDDLAPLSGPGSVPEPTALALLGSALGAALTWRRRAADAAS